VADNAGVRKCRSGWVILAAAAVVTLGGAFAVRAKKRRQRTPPAPPEITSRPAIAPPSAERGKSDPARALVRMAIGAGIFVVLAIATVVATAPRGGTDLRMGVAGPASRDERVVLTGDPGARVEVGIRAAGERLTPGVYLGLQNLVFVVHLRNTGDVWVGTRLDQHAWVRDAFGSPYAANQMLSLADAPNGSTDPVENLGWRLEPGWEVDRELVFTVPPGVRLTRLHLALPLGDATATAEWDLTR